MTDILPVLALLDTYVSQQRTPPQDYTVGLLRALVEHAPTEVGRRNICQDILACRYGATDTADSAKLFQLKQRYVTGLIIPLAAKGGKTPQVSDHPSRRESAELGSILNEFLMDDAKRDQARLKSQALARDDHRSVLSGQVDYAYADSVLDIGHNTQYNVTEAAHILPFSLSEGKELDQVRRNADVWQVIEHFSGMELLAELNGQKINRLGNVLTLTMPEHNLFGKLHWWLEAIEGQPNTYRVGARRALSGLYEKGTVVTFTTTDEKYELPDPRFLALHAACAKVAFASGMAGYIDHIIRDMEELAVLREDGSSDVQLMFALHRIPGMNSRTR
ncbi:hypothetical protein FRC10_001492 [Ceratobasidium sp. 414]|nr:hypothetical protein FRC10_001492 [Ceratobasidium sp. 414]